MLYHYPVPCKAGKSDYPLSIQPRCLAKCTTRVRGAPLALRLSGVLMTLMSNGPYQTPEAFFATLRSLIDAWCERRELRVLALILPSFVAFNNMTDGWEEIMHALKNLVAFRRDDLTPAELETMANLRQAIDDAFNR
jgi:hypothetical protein